MRQKIIIACLLTCGFGTISGCSLDEVFSLDVSKNACKNVKSLEIYTFDDQGKVKSRELCSEGDACTKDNNYRGALKYGICPDDISVCRTDGAVKFCSVCESDKILCGRNKNCVNPLTDSDHCGAKGFCNSDDPSSENYAGKKCDTENKFTCVNGECFSEIACEEGVNYPTCEGQNVVKCVSNRKSVGDTCDGVLTKCENGACVPKTCDVSEFNNSCDPKKENIRIYCNNGTVDQQNCEARDQICVAGACVAKTCEELGISDKTCDDNNTYRTCDGDGRVEYKKCGDTETCVDGEGCKLITQCDRDACYENPTEDQKKLLRICKNGSFEDMDCETISPGMFCSDGKCVCTLGTQRCYEKEDGSWRVEKCVEDAGIPKWVTSEDCTSDKPICDDQEFYCHDEAQNIGSPCQMIVVDENGGRHYCNNSNLKDDEADKYCSDYVSGKYFSKFVTSTNFIKDFGEMGSIMYGVINSEVQKHDDFFVYSRNIFPKDATIIKGCKNVKVPEGMTLGCITSESSMVFKYLSSFIDSFKSAQNLGVRVMDEKLVDWLEVFTASFMDNQGGFNFESPNGYCLVGSYDLTVRGYVFDTYFGEPKEPKKYAADAANYTDGWNVLGFHDNPEEKLSGLMDVINTPTRHKEAIKAVCPEGTETFHYTEPLMLSIDTDEDKDFIGRLGYDLCLKPCEKDEDCREGYNCLALPSRAPDRFEKVKDVVEAGEFKKVCFNQETVARVGGLRDSLHFKYKEINNGKDYERDAQGNLVRYPITKEDCEHDDAGCRGDIERDWQNDNNHFEPKP